MSLHVVTGGKWPAAPTIFLRVPTSSHGQLKLRPIAIQERPQEITRLPLSPLSSADPYASLTPLDDLIEELKATEWGRRAYEEADREWEEQAGELIHKGRLSRLRYQRIKAGLTQEALAHLSGIQQPNLQRLERPGYRGRLATYQRVAKALGCDYRELLP